MLVISFIALPFTPSKVIDEPAEIAGTLKAVLERNRVTRIVNCVGVVKPALIENVTISDFDAVIALNLRCAVQCVQALVPGMRQAGFGRDLDWLQHLPARPQRDDIRAAHPEE